MRIAILKTQGASHSPNIIHQNFPFAIQSRVQSSHNHSQHTTKHLNFIGRRRSSPSLVSGLRKSDKMCADNSIKMLPLTKVKGNC